MKNSTIRGVYERNELPSIFVDDWLTLDKNFFLNMECDHCDFKNVKNFLKVGYHMKEIENCKRALIHENRSFYRRSI